MNGHSFADVVAFFFVRSPCICIEFVSFNVNANGERIESHCVCFGAQCMLLYDKISSFYSIEKHLN